MLRYVAQRCLVMLPTLLAISFIIFVVIKLPPGDYLSTLIEEHRAQGESFNLQEIERLRKEYNLDRPFLIQYAIWIGVWPNEGGQFKGLLQGYLGYSFEYQRDVHEIIGDRLWLSIIVSIATVIFTWVVAFPIGVYSATHQYSWADHSLTFLGFLGLGLDEPAIGLGTLVHEGSQELDYAPWTLLLPAALLVLTLATFQQLGDALRDALNPRRAAG